MSEGSRAAAAAAERAARDSYGRLLALLAAHAGDVRTAEDALSGAFEQALRTWPTQGVPRNPDGWLLTVARNAVRDVWRSAAHRRSVPLDLAATEPLATPPPDLDPDDLPDRRLALLLVCAHPAIAPDVRTPLMLQSVLGLPAADVARLFAVPPATMAQRLVRAKRRIATAGIPFAVPDRSVLVERLPAVREAVYGAASAAWHQDDPGLAGEAQHLAVVLARLLEDDAEAWALAALVTFALARRHPGPFVPLDEQDPTTWRADLLTEAETYLRRADRPGVPGRFRLEAAIQAVHCDRRRTGRTDWTALRTLYLALDAVAPGLGARTALAVVVGRTDGAQAGLAALPPEPEAGFQPWWAARADLLGRAGRATEAADAWAQAAALATDDDVRAHLLGRRDAAVRAAQTATAAGATRTPATVGQVGLEPTTDGL